jgi:hypothetical protein
MEDKNPTKSSEPQQPKNGIRLKGIDIKLGAFSIALENFEINFEDHEGKEHP